nr:MAG TPA: hypothetical protein [Caudoviricetes sp.]
MSDKCPKVYDNIKSTRENVTLLVWNNYIHF